MKTSTKPGTELPPFIRSWPQFYALIIGWLVFLILLFSWITRYFA